MVTPIHELKPGDYIIPYQVIQTVTVAKLPTFDFTGEPGPQVLHELNEEKVIISTPWISGTPYKIVAIAPPLILVSAVNNTTGKNPPLFFDSAVMTFIKIPDEFKRSWAKEYNRFLAATGKKSVAVVDRAGAPLQQTKIMSFEQQVNKFLEGTKDGK